MRKRKSTKPYTLASLEFMHSEDKVWLNPDYQRESVWTRSQKQLFIDSLLREIDIPKLYFREIDNGTFEFEVVDGQQRLRTVFEFLSGDFPLGRESDDVDGSPTAGKTFKKLELALQLKLKNVTLDIVELNAGYSDDDIEEIFLRLQNGTPLNAPEKRRAIAGTMRNVVEQIAGHRVFRLAGFTNKRYAYEDAVAKTLHIELYGSYTDIKPASIAKTYVANKTLDAKDKIPRRLTTAYNFLAKAFKDEPSPKFKKYAFITLGVLVSEMLEEFDLASFPVEFAEAYRDFEAVRVANGELDEPDQDSALSAYTEAARSDSIPSLVYRHDYLKAKLLAKLVDLAPKDPTRGFSTAQRLAIYQLGSGVCVECNDGAKVPEDEFHADHVTPHSRGGRTTVANGQVLCAHHNLAKGSSIQ